MKRLVRLSTILIILVGCTQSSAPDAASTPGQSPSPASGQDLSTPGGNTAALLEDRYPTIPFNENYIHRDNAGVPGEDGWCHAESTLGGFSVDVPGKFSDSILKIKNEQGTSVFHHIRYDSDGLRCHVMKLETEQPIETDVAAELAEDMRRSGASVALENTSVNGFAAQKLTVESESVYAITVILRLEDSEFMISTQSDEPTQANRETAKRFVESFDFKAT